MPIFNLEGHIRKTIRLHYPASQKVNLRLESTGPVDVYIAKLEDMEKVLADVNKFNEFFATRFEGVTRINNQLIELPPVWVSSGFMGILQNQWSLVIGNPNDRSVTIFYEAKGYDVEL